jgi:hypothetical protein
MEFGRRPGHSAFLESRRAAGDIRSFNGSGLQVPASRTFPAREPRGFGARGGHSAFLDSHRGANGFRSFGGSGLRASAFDSRFRPFHHQQFFFSSFGFPFFNPFFSPFFFDPFFNPFFFNFRFFNPFFFNFRFFNPFLNPFFFEFPFAPPPPPIAFLAQQEPFVSFFDAQFVDPAATAGANSTAEPFGEVDTRSFAAIQDSGRLRGEISREGPSPCEVVLRFDEWTRSPLSLEQVSLLHSDLHQLVVTSDRDR